MRCSPVSFALLSLLGCVVAVPINTGSSAPLSAIASSRNPADIFEGVPPPRTIFLGFRGTHSRAAASYRRQDWSGESTRDLVAQLGDGIYLTDDLQDASDNAANAAGYDNDKTDGNVLPSICAVFARNSPSWLLTPKVFLPPKAWDDGRPAAPEALLHQANWIASNVLLPSVARLTQAEILQHAETFVKLANSDPYSPVENSSINFHNWNVMKIPRELAPLLHVSECIDYASNPPQLSDFSQLPVNKIDYRDFMGEWGILGSYSDQVAPVRERAL
ncbi:hypothetical protein HGRIS_004383 [Hohenbuehelia grisea]|uniref:Uncharacterized protein n=1 Tax=Hohenbuehelia grisea TaxID=104357 RepID=A0ABR3JBT4_9AGAR